MSLQDVMTNRRTFLQRSALGFGSVLFAPLLLESCTDHAINPPVTPVKPPLLGDNYGDNFGWNNDAKILVVSSIEMIPVAGDLLGGLVEIFWPDSKPNLWDTIKGQVEELIDQKLSDLTYSTVTGNLNGLEQIANNYKTVLTAKDKDTASGLEAIRGYWRNLRDDFTQYKPNFQISGEELVLLPLFGQFANMFLSVLRDGVAYGTDWGLSGGEVQQAATLLTGYIKEFYDYTADTYNNGRLALAQKTKTDTQHHLEPFTTINRYDRQMTLTVLHFMDTWPYYDITQFPFGTNVGITREFYSDPMGTADESGNIVIATPSPTQFPTQLTVWAGDFINAVQLTYPAGSGPGGVTQTPRMGVASGGNPFVYNLSNNPIIVAEAATGSVVNAFHFLTANNTDTGQIGGQGGAWQSWNPTLSALSSIHINGESYFYKSADCVVFGFMYWQAPEATLKAIRSIYVTSPKERSAADFAKDFPNLAIPADLITEELKTARQKHWAYVAAYVAAHK